MLQSGFTNSKDVLWLSSWDFILLPILANNAISLDQNFACGFLAGKITLTSTLFSALDMVKTSLDSYLEVFLSSWRLIFAIPPVKWFFHGQV